MARPRRDAAEPDAKTRIKRALWKLCQEHRLSEITVELLLRTAHCNRTTFYYHYKNLGEARDDMERDLILIERAQEIVGLAQSHDVTDEIKQFYSEHSDVLRYVSRCLADPADSTMRRRIEGFIVNAWKMNGIEESLAHDQSLRMRLLFCRQGF